MTLDQFLDNKYNVTARLPALSGTHQRYVVQGTSGTPEQFVLSFCDYSRPVGRASLERQRRVVEAMSRPPVALLCRSIDSRLEPDYQWMVSEFPGEFSLKELLQQRQSLTMDEVEAFLRLLTEACEAATTLGWPRLSLEAANLFIDARLGLPRIPAPDIPSFEASGSDVADFDPMATMQFNVADLRPATDPIPKDTHDYVLPLAALCCDLLGQPQSMRGGNARYQPVPQLTSQQNVLLRRALTSEGRAGFASAKSFMDDFFGISMSPSIAAHTERLRTMTVTIPRTNQHQQTGADAADVSPLAVTIRVAQPPPLPEMKKPEPPAPVRAAVSVNPDEKAAAQAMRPTTRLRLLPDHEEAPIFALVADEWLTLGRSAADADFVAQFRPRSNVNDGRSRRISRTQSRLRLTDDQTKIKIHESSAVNPSVVNDAPVSGSVETDPPVNFLLAGEYPVEIRMMPGDYPEKREIIDWPEVDGGPLGGALIIRAGGAGVLLCEAAIVFSDVGLHFSKSGRPWFRAEAGAVPAARIHRIAGQFWLEPIAASVFSRAGNMDTPTLPHELLLLRDGDKLRFGPYGYKVLGYALTGGGAPTSRG